MADYEVIEISAVDVELVTHQYGGEATGDDDGSPGTGPMGIWGAVEG